MFAVFAAFLLGRRSRVFFCLVRGSSARSQIVRSSTTRTAAAYPPVARPAAVRSPTAHSIARLLTARSMARSHIGLLTAFVRTKGLGITYGGKLRVPLGLSEFPPGFEESGGLVRGTR